MPKNLTYALWRDCHMNYCPNSQLKHALESAILLQYSGVGSIRSVKI